jgi:hypothetical protein
MPTAIDDEREEHDPLCPRSDMEAAWNGAECHCVVIRLLREIDGATIERVDFGRMWNEIDIQVNKWRDEGLGK